MNDHHQDAHLGDDLEAYVLGDASMGAAARAAADRHLEGCARCRGEVEQTRLVLRALEAPGLAPSAGFDARVTARLDALDEAATPPGRLVWLTRPRALAGGLAVAAAVMLTAVTLRTAPPSTPSPPTTGLDAEELELARYLFVVENLELLDKTPVIEVAEMLEVASED